MTAGLRSAMAASRARDPPATPHLLPRSEQDIPINYVGFDLARLHGADRCADRQLCGRSAGLGGHMLATVAGALVYIALMSFFVSAVCGYMAGLIGSSNSPLVGHRHPGGDRRGAAAGARYPLRPPLPATRRRWWHTRCS